MQYAPVKVQLLVVQAKVLGTHSRCLRIPNRRSTDFTLLSNMSPGINLFDGTFEHDGRLDSGLAFAQQQAELCLQPTANNQPPVMDQCKQLLAEQANRLQRSFDDKLKAQARSFDDKLQAQTEKQDAVTAFTVKPILLRLASDILSLTLSAVRQDSICSATNNSWNQPLSQHQGFASQLQKLCQKQHCPLNGSTIAVVFNGIRLNRNGMSNWGNESLHACCPA